MLRAARALRSIAASSSSALSGWGASCSYIAPPSRVLGPVANHLLRFAHSKPFQSWRTDKVVSMNPLSPDFEVLVHPRNIAERGPVWVGKTKWDNSVSLWADQGSKRDIEVPVHDWEGTKTGTITLDGRIFNHPIRQDLMHAYVTWQLAKRRQGTHATKTRGEKRGGGRKPRPQKGTGQARVGSIRSPLLRGGGHAKAKKPRSWAIKLNKKVRRLALASALSSKAHEGRLIVLEDMACTGKTKEMARWVKGTIVPAGERVSVLLVDADKWSEEGEMLRRASGNIPGVAVVPAAGINVWQVLKHDYLVMSRGAVERAIERLDLPNLRGWRIRPAGYVSPWRRLRMEAEKERKAAGVRLEHVRRRASAMDVAYRHRIELYPGQERPRGVAEDTD